MPLLRGRSRSYWSTYPRGHLKRRLYAEGLKSRRCELCGQGEMWQGRRMALILDHLNGVRSDNRLSNLRIVCPNCGSRWDRAGRANHKLRRVDRPPISQLIREIQATSYLAVGRKYGVSDNAVRKWVRQYERERSPTNAL